MLRVAEHFEKTDTGRQRRANEDSLFARPPLFAVADGMGGARAGEVASRTVVELLEDGLPAGVTPEVGLAARAEEANARINDLARSDEQRAGMGTTLTAAYVADREVAIAHVGDSRAYRIRDGELERLTRDHSLVNELWERGKITEEEMETHPQRSVITRALGPEVTVEIDSRTYPAKDGDAFLLCSDGLTSMVPETRLAEIVRDAGSLEEAGRSLVAEANQRGGRDNITVILFRLEEVDGPTTAEAGEDQPTRVERGAAHEVRAAAAAAASTDAANTEAVAAEPQTVPERTVPRPARRREPAAAPSNGRRRGGRLMRFGPAMTVLVVMALISAGAWIASRAVYFLGTDDRGFVSVFRGLPYDLPAGIRLYERNYVSGVPASQLSRQRSKKLLDHQLRSKDDASDLVRRIERGELDAAR